MILAIPGFRGLQADGFKKWITSDPLCTDRTFLLKNRTEMKKGNAMNTWLESVHSDGTTAFASNPSPKLFEDVHIRLRFYEEAPVKHVILRSMPNGMERLDEMHIVKKENGFVYYESTLNMNENRIQYHFYLVCEDAVYFYTQREITTYLPDHTWNFVLLADYRQPSWVKDAVFYQIFPERFCNGDPSNDVENGEYCQNGHPPSGWKAGTFPP